MAPMQLQAHGRTDVGNVRTNNEDNFLCDVQLGLFAVCDGMGGHAAGEVASAMACTALAALTANLAQSHAQSLAAAPHAPALQVQLVKAACQGMDGLGASLVEAGQHVPGQRGMGTTCTALWTWDVARALVVHIGDSRLYVHRHGAISQLSQDHTLVAEWVAQGLLTDDEAQKHPQGHILARALGAASALPAECYTIAIGGGDTFLLCSDGLHAYLPDDATLSALLAGDDLGASLDTLIDQAKAQGGHDNLTGVLIRARPEARGDAAAPSLADQLRLMRVHPAMAPLKDDLLRRVGALATWHASNQAALPPQLAQGCFWLLRGSLQVQRHEGDALRLSAYSYYAAAPLGHGGLTSPTLTLGPHSCMLELTPAALRHLIISSPVLGAHLLAGLLGAPAMGGG